MVEVHCSESDEDSCGSVFGLADTVSAAKPLLASHSSS